MRRLDELLNQATDRGDWMGPQQLIVHLERRLQGEREVVVASTARRHTMVDTKDRPAATEIPKPKWARWGFALTAFAVVAAAVVVAAVFIGGTGDDAADPPQTPQEVMALLSQAVEAADPVQYANLRPAPIVGQGSDFLEWNLALGLDPVFTDCAKNANSTAGNPVTCNVTMGEDYFYSVILGENKATTVSVRVDQDGTFDVQSWPPPVGLTTIEADMRSWIRDTHPEVEDRMFGSDYADIRFSKEAGELHMQYMDEYRAYRADNS